MTVIKKSHQLDGWDMSYSTDVGLHFDAVYIDESTHALIPKELLDYFHMLADSQNQTIKTINNF